MIRRNKAFTLIELLVVIAIIAILVAILFPVFAQAREKARQTSCLSNEKQISLALLMYTQDYDECFPISVWWGAFNVGTPGADGWIASIQPYVKNLAVFGCPSDSGAFKNAPDPAGYPWDGVYLSYVGNAYHGGWSGSYNYAEGPIGYEDNVQPSNFWMEQGAQTLAKMTQPAGTILIAEKFAADNIQYNPGYFPGANGSLGFPTGDVITNDMSDFGQNAPDGTRDPTLPYPNGPEGAIRGVHNGFANFAFVDGHVKSMKPVQTDPDPINHPELNLWNGIR
jgi:prepilin-type N-terminal cleavage/methylation domain-containing protein/prepilin-type processing-associated H-X9-DG protein